MPIYEPDLSYEDMKKAQYTFKCAQCGGNLFLAWSAQKNSYMLKCGKVLEHEGVVPLGRDPELLQIAKLYHGKELPMETTALMKLDQTQMLRRVEQAKFPKDLTVADLHLIAKVSIEYGLDPLFGELMIYQGRPYITIDARRRKAQETGNLDGISARPATEQERQARQVAEGDYLFVAEVWVKGSTHPFEGWGKVSTTETERARAQAKAHGKQEDALPIVKDPAAQAEKRAEAQALRRGFHLPLPSFEEVVEGEFSEVTPEEKATKSKPSLPKAETRPTVPPASGTATEAQKKKIWADARKMGYQDIEVHQIIKAKWGVESVHTLTIAQASALIDMIARGEGLQEPPPEEGEE